MQIADPIEFIKQKLNNAYTFENEHEHNDNQFLDFVSHDKLINGDISLYNYSLMLNVYKEDNTAECIIKQRMQLDTALRYKKKIDEFCIIPLKMFFQMVNVEITEYELREAFNLHKCQKEAKRLLLELAAALDDERLHDELAE